MEICLWGAVAILALLAVILLIKIGLLKKSADEIGRGFAKRLTSDTNTLIDISSHDKHMRNLASTVNTQLRILRVERQRYQQGDAELKEAVTNISHDLRTPLTAISGYLQLLDKEEKSEDVTRYIEMISNRTQVLKNLTEELFLYSVITSEKTMKVETVILQDVLEESLAASYGALTQRGINPEIKITEQRVERLLDRSALTRVFENIISNAVKYSDGDLSVKMSEDGTIEFSNKASNLNSITTGRLFDRYYTVETGRSSTGLGLSIAKLLSERMGGSITAEYQHGRLYIVLRF